MHISLIKIHCTILNCKYKKKSVDFYMSYFRYNLMQKCWHVDPEKRPKFEYCLKVLKSYLAMPLDYINIPHDRM